MFRSQGQGQSVALSAPIPPIQCATQRRHLWRGMEGWGPYKTAFFTPTNPWGCFFRCLEKVKKTNLPHGGLNGDLPWYQVKKQQKNKSKDPGMSYQKDPILGMGLRPSILF